MRESFGGVFMMKLFLVFIVIYVGFTAVSLNYAKSFKTKNEVIDFIEESQIMDLNKLDCDALSSAIIKTQYNKTCNNGNGPIVSTEGITTGVCCNGVVIEEGETTKTGITHYKVTTYADWNLGALNMILALGGRSQNSEPIVNGTWEINGEAKVKHVSLPNDK